MTQKQLFWIGYGAAMAAISIGGIAAWNAATILTASGHRGSGRREAAPIIIAQATTGTEPQGEQAPDREPPSRGGRRN